MPSTQYHVRIEGQSPLIHHSGAGIDPQHPANQEIARITKKKASSRTEVEHHRIRELEVLKSLWLDGDRPTVPAAALRAAIEAAARKGREGPAVREGLIVVDPRFSWDAERYGADIETICTNADFTVPVVVQRSRILRTRAKFDPPWAVDFVADCDDELVDEDRLREWLEMAGRRIGLGDWRVSKGGEYGRFRLESMAT